MKRSLKFALCGLWLAQLFACHSFVGNPTARKDTNDDNTDVITFADLDVSKFLNPKGTGLLENKPTGSEIFASCTLKAKLAEISKEYKLDYDALYEEALALEELVDKEYLPRFLERKPVGRERVGGNE